MLAPHSDLARKALAQLSAVLSGHCVAVAELVSSRGRRRFDRQARKFRSIPLL